MTREEAAYLLALLEDLRSGVPPAGLAARLFPNRRYSAVAAMTTFEQSARWLLEREAERQRAAMAEDDGDAA